MSIPLNKRKLTIFFGLFLFFSSFLFALSMLDVFNQSNVSLFFEKLRSLGLSIVIGVIFFPIMGTCFFYFCLSYYEKILLKPIEEALHYVSKPEKEIDLLSNSKYHVLSVLQQSIQDRLIEIQFTMQELSKELQYVGSQPQMFNEQTKEEILETERHRLARELHDSVSQELFAAMMMLSALNEVANQSADLQNFQKQLQLVTEIIHRAQSEMRALLLHLRPVNLEGKSLKVGMEQLMNELKSKVNIHIRWSIDNLDLPIAIEDQLFRVTQELLSNTLRHAKANELEVYLHQINQMVNLRFIDDGVGFTKDTVKPGSYGLMNIQERIQNLGGTIKIISFKNQGTSIEIKIPLFERGE